jgi:PIN domain nuclease of toxin-antitoxin system
MTTTSKYVVDTHALIWFLESNPRLGADAQRMMRDPSSELFLPVIALAEACWIIERGRTSIPSAADLLQDVDADQRVTVVPLDRDILDLSLTLSSIGEMHDRQIVATALLLQRQGRAVALLTKDANIVASGVVPIVW